MPRPWRIQFPGAKYHVSSRGNGRSRIFLCDGDYLRFLDQLAAALEADEVLLHAYCLMPNHFHLQVETRRGNLSRFMQRLNTAYSMYFRFKKSRPGHCLQGRYSAKLVNGDEYLLSLGRYIHMNPVNTKRVRRLDVERQLEVLQNYQWSSYRSYAGLAPVEEMVDYRWLKLMKRTSFKRNQDAYRRYVDAFVGKTDDVLSEADRASRYAIGNEAFREQIHERLDEVRLRRAEHGDIVWPKRDLRSVDSILTAVSETFKVPCEGLRCPGRRCGPVKAVAIELCCRYSGLTQRDLSEQFGYRSESSIGKQRKAFAKHVSSDRAMLRRYHRVIRALKSAES